jgi:DNA polymerase III epsilon subunit family exonuclease
MPTDHKSRHIALWIHTSGLEPSEGHRVVEIGAFRFHRDAARGEGFHTFLNPDREIDPAWSAQSGLTQDLLAESPRFGDVASELLEFCVDATLIFYDAVVAVGFLNHELRLWDDDAVRLEHSREVIDLRALARKAGAADPSDFADLCRRYAITLPENARQNALSQAHCVAALYQAMTNASSSGAGDGYSSTFRTIRIPDIAWIEVPGGEFLYGEERELRRVETFWMARYPLTNAQYQTFIDDGGYADARWWRDLARPEPAEPKWPQPNRPRTDVSWSEAVAFCRWLSSRLGLGDDSVRLPTEMEWERAARGTDGRVYPWGDDFRSGSANVDEPLTERGAWYLGQTTAVGLFPHGRSPSAIEDMVGTVWEWCANKYENPEFVAPDSTGATRVMRGGAWFDVSGFSRIDHREGYPPDVRSFDLGFRLCSSVAMVDR